MQMSKKRGSNSAVDAPSAVCVFSLCVCFWLREKERGIDQRKILTKGAQMKAWTPSIEAEEGVTHLVTVCDKWRGEDDFLLARTPFERNAHTPKGENREYVCEKDRGII